MSKTHASQETALDLIGVSESERGLVCKAMRLSEAGPAGRKETKPRY